MHPSNLLASGVTRIFRRGLKILTSKKGYDHDSQILTIRKNPDNQEKASTIIYFATLSELM